ncbi:hypothetical protein [Kitasatospora griseola]|uniref:hypothetical protein n=1 Tax=Kitasatospora griseola TaxID=2064 RepID=UPI003440FA54
MVVTACLVFGAVFGGLAACRANGPAHGERVIESDASKTTGLRTDMAPMVTRFHRFGELVDAQWVLHWPGGERELVPSNEHPMFAVLHLKPGQVKRLLDGRRTEPASRPVFASDDLPHGGDVPASLAPHLPADAAWVLAPELDEVLVRARGTAAVRYDPGSDTVLVFCINPDDPDEVRTMVDTGGRTSLVTPSPFVPPS